jgi:hypothetical protein
MRCNFIAAASEAAPGSVKFDVLMRWPVLSSFRKRGCLRILTKSNALESSGGPRGPPTGSPGAEAPGSHRT